MLTLREAVRDWLLDIEYPTGTDNTNFRAAHRLYGGGMVQLLQDSPDVFITAQDSHLLFHLDNNGRCPWRADCTEGK